MKVRPSATPGQVVVQLNPRDDLMLDESVRQAVHAPFRMKKILVPVDFSECSSKAIEYARPFAREFGAEILLVHVVEPMIIPENLTLISPDLPVLGDTLVAAARERLARVGVRAASAEIKVQTVVRVGRAFHEIIEAAKEEDADLIIIATHGYTGLKHAFMGSTAERVVRHAPCPVLTVRQPGR